MAKLRKFLVPITVTISSEIPVSASSKAEALKKVQKLWAERYTKKKPTLDVSHVGMNSPSFDVDFAYGDDPESVEEAEEDEG